MVNTEDALLLREADLRSQKAQLLRILADTPEDHVIDRGSLQARICDIEEELEDCILLRSPRC